MQFELQCVKKFAFFIKKKVKEHEMMLGEPVFHINKRAGKAGKKVIGNLRKRAVFSSSDSVAASLLLLFSASPVEAEIEWMWHED